MEVPAKQAGTSIFFHFFITTNMQSWQEVFAAHRKYLLRALQE